MAITDSDIDQAEQRTRQLRAETPHAVGARYDRRVSRIVVSLSNGLELAFPPYLAEGLSDARPAALSVIEITPTGLGLHWPELDADLYLPSLLAGVFGSPRWMAGLLGKTGGVGTDRSKSRRRAKKRQQRGPATQAGGALSVAFCHKSPKVPGSA